MDVNLTNLEVTKAVIFTWSVRGVMLFSLLTFKQRKLASTIKQSIDTDDLTPLPLGTFYYCFSVLEI